MPIHKEMIPNVKFWWLIIISVLLRWLPFGFSETSSLVDFTRVCMILSYTLLLFALLRNMQIWSVRIIALGTLLNFLAIIANHGFMPVSSDAISLANKTLLEMPSNGISLTGLGGVILPVDGTRLWLLTDIIPVSSISTVFSIGDIVLGIGILVACISLIGWARRTMHPDVPELLTIK